MKKFTFVFASLLCVSFMAMAQLRLYVYQNDGERTEFVAANVDSIAFSASAGPSVPDANGHEYVDLGLPSGNLWATMNVGATTPEDYGYFLAWGETSPKEYYTYGNYKFMMPGKHDRPYITKYQTHKDTRSDAIWFDENHNFIGDDKLVLDLEDDAAHVNMGGDWVMPTPDDLTELFSEDNCTLEFLKQHGVVGLKVVSNTNGNSLFIPCAGWINELEHFDEKTGFDLWTNALMPYFTYQSYIFSGVAATEKIIKQNIDRIPGRSVRGVLHTK